MSDVSNATDATPMSDEHAEMLATKWWSGDRFRQHGVPCRDGPFALAETELVQDAINKYRTATGMSQYDVMNFIAGKLKRDGLWEKIARAVPGRRVRSVHDHARSLFATHRDPKKWTHQTDWRLMNLVKKKLSWAEIGENLRRTEHACRNRYQKYLVCRGTRHQGDWSPEEEARLNNVMQVMTDEGKVSGQTPKFWKQVSARLDNTRTPEQCRIKWRYSLSPTAKSCPRNRWREADKKILLNKVAHLDLDMEEDINWDELSRTGWNGWSAEKLQVRWADLKAGVDSRATHRDVVQQLTSRWGITPP